MLGLSCLFSMGMYLGGNIKYGYHLEADIALEGVVICARRSGDNRHCLNSRKHGEKLTRR